MDGDVLPFTGSFAVSTTTVQSLSEAVDALCLAVELKTVMRWGGKGSEGSSNSFQRLSIWGSCKYNSRSEPFVGTVLST